MHERGYETMRRVTQHMGLKPDQLLHVIGRRKRHSTPTPVFSTVESSTQVLGSSHQLLDATARSRLPGSALCGCCELCLLTFSLSISVKDTQKHPHLLP